MAKTKLSTIARCTVAITGALALVYTGCSMCCGPYDYDYPSFGGAVQRSNPTWGRVGSVYSDPGSFGGPSADSNLKPHDAGFSFGDDSIETVPKPGSPDDLQMQSPENGINGSGNRNGSSGVLPEPPQPGPQTRPSPDDETRRSIFQRLRNQSRGNSDRKWR